MITTIGLTQILVYLFILFLLVKPLGLYMAKVFNDQPFGVKRIGGPVERLLYRLGQVKVEEEMDWKKYLLAMLVFNFFGFLAVYVLQRVQGYLPLNPQHFNAPDVTLAFNTAVSFATNTNWQSYGGETTMSYLTQMLALTTQNFLSAATGMALLIALIRGISGYERKNLGNFWVDVTRGTLYILLPLSFILSIILVSQGVIQNFKPNEKIKLLEPMVYQTSLNNIDNPGQGSQTKTATLSEQVIPMGPAASQIAIKQLGTNGGGFFNVNSAHPFENPTPVSNFFELLAILLIPAAFCYTFGVMVNDRRQGWAILAAMFLLFIPFIALAVFSEQQGTPTLIAEQVNVVANANTYPGGNMEGKETRFGIVSSALWAVATTAASNGAVNSMLDSYTPIGGLAPLWLMQLGEIVFGGVGSGLYGMLLVVIIAVFVGGLMVGRTPEYLGKKIEPFEMKMASIAVLIMPIVVLIATAIGSVIPAGVESIANPGMHGFSEILYAFTSMGNNNGSAFAGLHANTPFYNVLGGLLMLISRYWIAIPVLAISGSLMQKKIIPQNAGTLATHTPLFIILIASIAILVGALSFLPALALGPIVEYIHLWGLYGY